MVRLILMVVSGLFFVALLSLAWHRLTPTPRPMILTAIRSSFLKTPLGLELSNVLGVSDETQNAPLDPAEIVKNAREKTLESINQRFSFVLTTQAIRGLLSRFDELSEEQKSVLREYVCSTDSGSGSVSQPYDSSSEQE